MKKAVLIGLVVVVIGLTSGCSHMLTHTYTPKVSKFDMDKIHKFSVKNDVTLINRQSDSQQVLFAKNAMHTFYTDYNDWTDVAVVITSRELLKRGGHVSADAEKSLELSVLSSKVTSGGWGFRGHTKLHAKTGSGYEQTYHAEVPSSILNRAADGALARAVMQMLSDKEIAAYLSE